MLTTLRQLNYLLTPRARRGAAGLFCLMLVGAVLDIVGLGAIPVFVVAVSKPERMRDLPFVGHLLRGVALPSQRTLIVGLGLGLTALFVVKNSYLALLTHLQARFAAQRQASISTRLFRAYLHAPYTFHLQRNSAELHRNTDHEAKNIATAMFQLVSLMLELFVLTLLLGGLLVVAPVVTAVTGILFGGSTVLFHRATRRQMTAMAAREQWHQAEEIKVVQHALGGIKDVKVLGREHYFLDTFARSATARAQAGGYRTLFSSLPRFFLETMGPLSMVGVTLILLLQGHRPEIILSTLTLLAVTVVRLLPSFQRIAYGLSTLRWGETSLHVVHADLRELEGVAEARTQASCAGGVPPAWASIAFERVGFTYAGSPTPAIADVSLSISCGSVIGIVGASGAGKSTLVDLLLGLLTPTRGRILVGGVDVQTDLRSWQRQIGYIPQHIYLTDDTIRRNIAFGLLDAEIDDAAIARAIEAAQLTEFIASLPAGHETVVGELGVRLSGGQRQRIGIARALYHDPPVLVMDEATSALDHRTERRIVESLEALRGRHTLVIIAHRMSTVRHCDALFMLKEGRLVASGAFEDLRATSQDFRAISA